jgi:sugar O-acyltransferase (sialic acid O-acetyltransferase NeuD family)
VRGDRYTLESIVDPTAQVSPSAHYGLGIILFPHTYLSSCSDLSDNVLINAGSIVGHDTCIGENTVVSPLVSVSGICSIGSDSFIGTGACIKEKVSIGARTIVGMGACVFRDIGPGMIVVGNPARESRQNIDQSVFRSTK